MCSEHGKHTLKYYILLLKTGRLSKDSTSVEGVTLVGYKDKDETSELPSTKTFCVFLTSTKLSYNKQQGSWLWGNVELKIIVEHSSYKTGKYV